MSLAGLAGAFSNLLKSVDLAGEKAALLGGLREWLNRETFAGNSFRYIPRARFGAKGDKCLIMVHAGMDRFLRLEFVSENGDTIVKKQENTWDPSKITETIVNSGDHFAVALDILKGLLGAANILIGALEWDTYEERHKDVIINHFGPEKVFRAAKLVFFGKHDSSIPRLMLLCANEFTNGRESLRVVIAGDDHLVPTKAIRTTLEPRLFPDNMQRGLPDSMLKNDLIDLITEPVNMAVDEERLIGCVIHENRGIEVWTFSCADQRPLKKRFDEIQSEAQVIQVNEKVTCHRIIREDVVLRFNKAPCGYWLDAMPEVTEKKLRNEFRSRHCGIGCFCPNCTDPFAYAYCREILQRAVREPNWDSVFLKGFAYDGYIDDLRQNMKAALKSGRKFKYHGDMTLEELSQEPVESAQDPAEDDVGELLAWIRGSLDPKMEADGRTALYPHVRLGVKEKKSLIVVHTEIGKSVRVEFVDGSGGETLATKWTNGATSNAGAKKTVEFGGHLHVALLVLKELIGRANAVVDVFELETYGDEHYNTIALHLYQKAVFRIKKLLIPKSEKSDYTLAMIAMVNNRFFEGTEHIKVTIDNDENLVGLKTYTSRVTPAIESAENREKLTKSFMTTCQTNILMSCEDMATEEQIMSKGPDDGFNAPCTFACTNAKMLQDRFDEIQSEAQVIQVNEAVTCHRIVRNGTVLRYNKSPCGYWLDAMTPQLEEMLQEEFKSNKCNIGVLCKKCMSPFSHAYFRDIHHRIVNEEEWDQVLTGNPVYSHWDTRFKRNLKAELEAGRKLNYYFDQTPQEREYDRARIARLQEQKPKSFRMVAPNDPKNVSPNLQDFLKGLFLPDAAPLDKISPEQVASDFEAANNRFSSMPAKKLSDTEWAELMERALCMLFPKKDDPKTKKKRAQMLADFKTSLSEAKKTAGDGAVNALEAMKTELELIIAGKVEIDGSCEAD